MSRKDYRMIAAAIRDEVESADANEDNHTVMALARVARRLGERMKADNSRFDWGTFYTACGFESVML